MQFYNQSDTIQAYFDSVIAVNGTARPLLHSCKHSAVARLSFIAIASLIALYISKNTRKFRPSQGGVIAAISFGTMLVVMAILLAFNPIEKYERFDWQENLLQSIENSFNIDDGRKTSTEKSLNEIKGSLEEKENLIDISQLTQTHTPVMTVTSAVGGNIYLKGTAYADYRDNIWSIIPTMMPQDIRRISYRLRQQSGTML